MCADLLKSKIAQLIDLLNISSTIACHGCVCLIQSCTQCTMHNAQCTMPNAHVKLQSCMERISVDEFGLQACSLRLLPLCRLQCASLSLSYHFFHRDWLHGWLQILVITGQVAKMSWSGLRYPAIYCQRRIITFWYPLNWRWMFSQCTQIISLLQSGWPAPQFRCSLVKKGMRWISLRIRKRKKREEVNMAANQETPRAELSSSLCRWVNLAIYYSDQGGEHCLHWLHLHCLHCWWTLFILF